MNIKDIDRDRLNEGYQFAQKMTSFLKAFKDSEGVYSSIFNGISLIEEINSEIERLSSARDSVKVQYEKERKAADDALGELSASMGKARKGAEEELKALTNEHSEKIKEYQDAADAEIAAIAAKVDAEKQAEAEARESHRAFLEKAKEERASAQELVDSLKAEMAALRERLG